MDQSQIHPLPLQPFGGLTIRNPFEKIDTTNHLSANITSISTNAQPFSIERQIDYFHAHPIPKVSPQCLPCIKGFKHKSNLLTHLENHNQEAMNELKKQIAKCSVCGEEFRLKTEFMHHLNVQHSLLLRPFQCSICQKTFANSRDMSNHVISHFEKKMLQCSICKQKFEFKTQFVKHPCYRKALKLSRTCFAGKKFLPNASNSYITQENNLHTSETPFIVSIKVEENP